MNEGFGDFRRGQVHDGAPLQDGRQNAQKPAAGQSDKAATHPAGGRFLDLAQYARPGHWHDAWAELQFGATTQAAQHKRMRLWGFYG